MRLSELENTIIQTNSSKGLISKIYTSLLYILTLQSMTLWSCCGGVTWRWHLLLWIFSGIFLKCNSISIHKQNFNFFQRIYYIPFRLQRMFPDPSNLCSKCNTHKGAFIHLFWSCDRIHTIWKGVHSVIQKLVNSSYWHLLFIYLTMLQTISWTLTLNLWW